MSIVPRIAPLRALAFAHAAVIPDEAEELIRTRTVSPEAVVFAAKDAANSAAMFGPNVFSAALP